jgi:hypothetical protein
MASLPQQNSAVETPTRTPLEAIAAACRQCIYDPAEPTSWREQIAACTQDRCPLHQHRPTTTMAEGT